MGLYEGAGYDEMTNHDAGWGCVLPFDNDDPSFRRGVEVGVLWTLLHREPDEIAMQVHADCAEMLLRMSEATQRTLKVEDVDDAFIFVTFGVCTKEPQ